MKKFCLLILLLFPVFVFARISDVLKVDSNTVKRLLDSAYTLESTNSNKAIKVYKKANIISKEINYILGQAKALHYIGIVYSDRSEYPDALSMYRKAFKLYKKINYTRGIGACFVNTGNLYHFQSKLDSAVFYYQLSINIFRQYSHSDALCQSYSNIGIIFQKMGQLQKAYDYQKKGITLAKKINDSLVLCRGLTNQAAVLSDMKKDDESLAVSKEVLKIAQQIKDDYSLQITNINIADYYKKKNNYTKAIEFGTRSLEYSLKLGTPYDIADIKKRIADLYMLNHNYNKAKVYYEEAIRLSEQIKADEISADIYSALHKLYAKLKNYKQAYTYQLLAEQYRDSIFGEKQMKTINELEVKYQASQKEKALAQQRLEIAQKEVQLQKSERNTIYSIVAALLAAIICLLGFWYFRNKQHLHLRQLQSIQQEKEIQILQALMQGEEKERTRIARDLHDEVAGMLAAAKMQISALSSQVKEVLQYQSFSHVAELLDEATVSVRKTAHNLMPEILMQYGLDGALRKYCGNLSANKHLVIQYDSWGEIGRYSDSFELTVYRIVQELLNNVVKHSKATKAIVQLSSQDNTISITVEDNGIGFDKTLEANGMGLLALKSRIETLQGIIEVDSAPGEGVSIYLEFGSTPLKMEVEIED